jgi:hypothetical protein
VIKKLRPRKERQIRRQKAKDASRRQATERLNAITQAQEFVRPVLTALNDEGRDPDTRAQAQARRGVLPIPGLQWSPEEKANASADRAAGVATSRGLLAKWDQGLVENLLERVVVEGAEYVLLPDGSVELQPRHSSGPSQALAALDLAQARALLRQVDSGENPFKRRVKQCVNPTCEKWFFDAERGTRKLCCVPCGNAHRQLKLSETYQRRLKAGEFARRRFPCSRPDCEG